MKKTKLTFKTQTVAKLTADQLSNVHGGTPGSGNGNCSGTCHTCPERCATLVRDNCVGE